MTTELMERQTNGMAVRPTLIGSMASQYNLDPKMFEMTIRKTVMPSATTNEEFCAFLMVCKRYDLNPITREIYAFPKKGGGIQPIVGVDGWMNVVNKQPNFDGVEFVDIKDDTGKISAIKCKIFRKDRSHHIEVTEYMSECKRNSDPWNNWPNRMLRHKAFIQCARLAFGLSGIVDEDEYDRVPGQPVYAEYVVEQSKESPRTPMSGLKDKLKKAPEPQPAPLEETVNQETGELSEAQQAIEDLPSIPPEKETASKKTAEKPKNAGVVLPVDYKPEPAAASPKAKTEYIECIPERMQEFAGGKFRTHTTEQDFFDSNVKEFKETVKKAITGKNKIGVSYIVINGVASITGVKIL